MIRSAPGALVIALLATMLTPDAARAASLDEPRNGVESMTPQQALAAAGAALGAAADVTWQGHVDATLVGSRQRYRSTRVTTPTGCSEILSLGGFELRYLVKGRKAYLRAPKSYWRAHDAPGWAARRLADRWVKDKASQAERDGCRSESMVPLAHAAAFVAQPYERWIRNRPGIQFDGSDGVDPMVVIVATTGAAHVTKVRWGTDDDQSVYELAAVDAGVRIAKPRKARTLRGWLR
ncbi:hypothetical protein [Nocardioides sp. L-11A]|uniref:hypothetical protein n=1 Tax=Nocardioides sp. L-11A TaxID=3043848 RepID=UPI00249B25A5|nr:hypothetical protein QJ852_17405 [Nocardioides sp. L-11A]